MTDEELYARLNALPDPAELTDSQLKDYRNWMSNEHLDADMECIKRKLE